MKIQFLVVLLLLAGCSNLVTPIKTPDNKDGYLIKCDMGAMERCYNTAIETCPNGYVIINSVDGKTTGAGMYINGVFAAARTPNQIAIQCKEKENNAN